MLRSSRTSSCTQRLWVREQSAREECQGLRCVCVSVVFVYVSLVVLVVVVSAEEREGEQLDERTCHHWPPIVLPLSHCSCLPVKELFWMQPFSLRPV